VDLCAAFGGDAIDQALRTRAVTLATPIVPWSSPGRKGNRSKRELLLDSRAEPWGRRNVCFTACCDKGWCVLRFTRPASVGARIRRVQEHLVKQTELWQRHLAVLHQM
jgi:hypothetical protein